MNIELIVGIFVIAALIIGVAFIGGVNSIIYVGVTLIFGFVALLLLSRKSKTAKAGAYVLLPEILVNFIKPKSVSKSIEELKNKENET